MRKTALLMGSTALAVLLVCGVALADNIQCPNRAGNLCVGTTGDDTLTGTANRDEILGRDGGDLIKGRGGQDQLSGELGDDEIRAGGGADDVFGNRGNETTIASGGTPQPGIIGGGGPDGLNGGAGDDFILAANDGSSDTISCGASSGQGGDIVAFDQDNAGITDVLDDTCDDAQQVPIGEG
jgi:Ca2+-binding RTX toxin-like protein